eukprot:CAMPEP_0170100920 /NCGR_PEP_ID=MMETSP0020_2-20130122/1945_1 /TAXON_ID=98059 /ORGANISM="Dinobryon sp., Strain UTEXLB2267" /LENGTH=84 /DNA_ID=CAMNT_0010323907 /DNA_START=449 /DNA_END=699 /DNA_ORIENTATION=+
MNDIAKEKIKIPFVSHEDEGTSHDFLYRIKDPLDKGKLILQRAFIFVVFMKAIYGPDGKRLIDPSVTTPVMNFNELDIVGEIIS